MSAFWPALLLAGILPFGGDDEAKPFPVTARGDIRFEMDGARFQSGSASIVELYVALPLATLTESADSAGYARVALKVSFRDRDGDETGESVADTAWVPLVGSDAEVDGMQARHVLTLRPAAPEDARQIGLRIEDPSGRKRGLVDRARKKKPSGEALGAFRDERPPCGLSDISFAWDLDRSEGSAQVPVRLRLIPNPSRYYGLYHTSLLFYVESYGPPRSLRYRVLRVPDDEIVASGLESAGGEAQETQAFLVAKDLSTLRAGVYRLEVQDASSDSCMVSGTFQVLWETESWARDDKELLEEAFVLLPPKEYERVQEMSRGEVEVYMQDLWGRNDPDKATGTNELRDRYLERVEYADRFYRTVLKRGMLSDRGRVHIRFGPPDEITKELNPQDEELIDNVLPYVTAEDSYQQVRGVQDRNSRDDRAYEIWSYQVRGDPLFPDVEYGAKTTGLKFIFVDELGYGDMRLVYTNLSGAF